MYELCMCTKASELCGLELVTVDLRTSKGGLISDVTVDLWTSKEGLISDVTVDLQRYQYSGENRCGGGTRHSGEIRHGCGNSCGCPEGQGSLQQWRLLGPPVGEVETMAAQKAGEASRVVMDAGVTVSEW